jgi:hypothetical protein
MNQLEQHVGLLLLALRQYHADRELRSRAKWPYFGDFHGWHPP